MKHIFDNVVGPKGILGGKTRIMVTNNVTFLPKVDKIIVIKDGQISETGTYKELLNGTGAFKNFLLQYLTTEQDIPETIMHDLEEVLDKEEQIKLRRNSAASGKTTGVNMTIDNLMYSYFDDINLSLESYN